MAIFHLPIEDGLQIPRDGEDIRFFLSQTIMTRVAELQLKVPGEYDITPHSWTRNTHRHQLTVLDNGEGLYTMFARDEHGGFHTNSGSGLSEFQRGGKRMPINQEIPQVAITQPQPDKGALLLMGMVVYLSLERPLTPH